MSIYRHGVTTLSTPSTQIVLWTQLEMKRSYGHEGTIKHIMSTLQLHDAQGFNIKYGFCFIATGLHEK